MLSKVVFRYVLSVFACVSSSVVERQDKATDEYFGHPKDVRHTDGSRIMEGKEVKPHAYPFQTAVQINYPDSTLHCGGSLITNQWILTAAHCFEDNRKIEYIEIILGCHNLDEKGKAPVVVMKTKEYVIHKMWNSVTCQNDVALIKLPEPVEFTYAIQPVKLAMGSNQYVGRKATVLGWGMTERGKKSNVLKYVNTIVMRNDDCANADKNYRRKIGPNHICTSAEGAGFCDADSGDPLMVNNIQVGIVSFVTKNCTDLPSVYTRVAKFYNWIHGHARSNNDILYVNIGGVHLSVMTTLLLTLCLTHFFK